MEFQIDFMFSGFLQVCDVMAQDCQIMVGEQGMEEFTEMSNLWFSFNAIAPVFLLVGIGWLARKLGWVNESFVDSSCKLNFRTGLPALLFINIYQQESANFIDWTFVGFMVGVSFAVALILFFTIPRFVRDKSKASAMIHTILKPNILVLGYPLAVMIFGTKNSAAMSALLPALVLFNNIVAVLILYALDPRNRDVQSHSIIKSLISILKNPIVLSAIIAIIVKRLSISLPPFLVTLLSSLSEMATPLALITLGAQMTMEAIFKDRKYVAFATVCKVLLTPLVVVPFAYSFGFRSYELATAFIVAASPSAVNSYMLAREMHSDEVLTGEIILSSTLCSMFVLFVGIFLLKSLAIIS